MDNERTKSTNEIVTEKYTSDIVYVSELVKNYEHELIKRDDRIEKLKNEINALEQKIILINDRLYECIYSSQLGTKKFTKTEIVEKMEKLYLQLSDLKRFIKEV